MLLRRTMGVLAGATLTVLAAGTGAQAASTERAREPIERSYDCTVKRFGQNNCTGYFGVGVNRTVTVCYDAAGGNYGVDFRLIDEHLGQVGNVANLRRNQCEKLWTNTTSQRRSTYISVGQKNVNRFGISITVRFTG